MRTILRSLAHLHTALALFFCLATLLGIYTPLHAQQNPLDAVTESWQRARTAGGYSFRSDIEQTHIPTASIQNAGRTSHTSRYYLEGTASTSRGEMEMTLWQGEGSAAQPGSGYGIKIQKGKSWVRAGTEEWSEIDSFTDVIAPQGDFMAWLRMVKNVRAHAPESRLGIKFTRYEFEINSRALAQLQAEQMLAALRAKGELPPGAALGLPEYYEQMVGRGELWVAESGLPLRQILWLNFPEQNSETLAAHVTTDFSDYGVFAAAAGAAHSPSSDAFASGPPQESQHGLPHFFLHAVSDLLRATLPVFAALLLILLLSGALLYYQRSRVAQRAFVAAIIASMVAGPLLADLKLAQFTRTQRARAADVTAQQTAKEDANAALHAMGYSPFANPLEVDSTGATPVLYATTGRDAALGVHAPLSQSADFDLDGIADAVEDQIGTDYRDGDTDEDTIPDLQEVSGFTFGGKTWYLSPTKADSNGDGIADGVEWPQNLSQPIAPLDTDGDGVPDLFDDDNDGDGVPDSVDLSPFTPSPTTYTNGSPLALILDNLAVQKPIIVDFQIRPTDAKQIWFAYSVLDWPFDDLGQIQDRDFSTFGNYKVQHGGVLESNDWYGDTKIVPMLEIIIRDADAALPQQEILTAYNLSVRTLEDGSAGKAVYVPLNVVTDERSGERVAFNARMPYLRKASGWTSPQEVRLVWVVQMLNDSIEYACDPGAPQDCTPTRREVTNVPEVIQTFVEPWQLTGLVVSEELGTNTAVVWNNPGADGDLRDDSAMFLLANTLDANFLTPLDVNGDNQSDLTLKTIASDINTNSGWAVTTKISDTLQATYAEYDAPDRALATTTITTTPAVLSQPVFMNQWENDRAFKPLVLFANERSARTLSLDQLGSSYVDASANRLHLNMAPGGATAPVKPTTAASMKWVLYCSSSTTALPSWQPCGMKAIWDEMGSRYGTHSITGSYALPEFAQGRRVALQAYALALSVGINRLLFDGVELLLPESGSSTSQLAGEWVQEILVSGATGRSVAVQAVTAIVTQTAYQPDEALSAIGDLDWLTASSEIAGQIPKLMKKDLTFQSGVAVIVASVGVLSVVALAAGAAAGDDWVFAAVTSVLASAANAFLAAVSLFSTMIEFRGLIKTGETASTVCTVIGGVVMTVITWGFFIASVLTSGIHISNGALREALVETIVSTVMIVLLTILALSEIGGIIVAIYYLLDAIMALICTVIGVAAEARAREEGKKYEEEFCFTFSEGIMELVRLIRGDTRFVVTVDLADPDLVEVGKPTFLVPPGERLFIEGVPFDMMIPITTTLEQTRAVTSKAASAFALHEFAKSAILYTITPMPMRFSSGTVGFEAPYNVKFPWQIQFLENVAISEPSCQWVSLGDGLSLYEQCGTITASFPRFSATSTTHIPVKVNPMVAGPNRVVDLHVNFAYAVPQVDCQWFWYDPDAKTELKQVECGIPGALHDRISLPMKDFLVFDVLPKSLNRFMEHTGNDNRARWSSWLLSPDGRVMYMGDADNDGLHRSVDRDDTTWDSDGDGLSDAFELESRNIGKSYDMLRCDTDGDGLTDAQESFHRTDPGRSDTDRDGISDAEEVWHEEHDANCVPTGIWSGGWTINVAGLANPLLVQSDPLHADSDKDGLIDLEERNLALAGILDNEGRIYHPAVANSQPVSILLQISDTDNMVASGQSFTITANFAIHTPLETLAYDIGFNIPGGISPVDVVWPWDGYPGAYFNITDVPATRTREATGVSVTLDNSAEVTMYATAVMTPTDPYAPPLPPSRTEMKFLVDAAPPTAVITSHANGQYVQSGATGSVKHLVIGGNAADADSGIAKVEVRVNGGDWLEAQDTEAWSFVLPVAPGQYTIEARATDAVGNVGAPSTPLQIIGDPEPVLVQVFGAEWVAPVRDASGDWFVPLEYVTQDAEVAMGVPGSGVERDTVHVQLRHVSSASDDQTAASELAWQQGDLVAVISQLRWVLEYAIPAALTDPSGWYNIYFRLHDQAGNSYVGQSSQTPPPVIKVDAVAPAVSLNAAIAASNAITGPNATIGGLLNDGASGAGVDALQIRIVPEEEARQRSGALLDVSFDEGAGWTYFRDDSTQRNQIRCTPGGGLDCPVSGVPGRDGNAVAIQPIYQNPLVVDNPDQFDFARDEEFTVGAWLDVDNAASGVPLLGKEGAWGLWYVGGSQLVWRFWQNASQYTEVVAASTSGANDWHYYMVTAQRLAAGSRYRAYRDGILQGEVTIPGKNAHASTAPVEIANFTGRIDTLLILPRALSDATVKALYRAETVPWQSVLLASRGQGVAQSAWNYTLPSGLVAGLEGSYNLDMRTVDMLGNSVVRRGVWSGLIDTKPPRLQMTAIASTTRQQIAVRSYTVAYQCKTEDLFLAFRDPSDEESLLAPALVCPGTTMYREPVFVHANSPLLQELYPDVSIISAISTTLRAMERTLANGNLPARTATSCDTAGNCASVTVTPVLPPSTNLAFAAGATAPAAYVTAPAEGDFVAADGAFDVTVYAEASNALRRISLELNGAEVGRVDYPQSAALKSVTVQIPVNPVSEGAYTLVAKATDWNGATQGALEPVHFMLDRAAPTAAITRRTITKSDQWWANSGWLRFAGTAGDTFCLASVQVAADNGPYRYAIIENGAWRLAYWVNAPEGRTLATNVRATDCAGRVTEITENVTTSLSSPDAPNTTIASGPPSSTADAGATFTFAASAGANEVMGLFCQLDDGPYVPCTSPTSVSELTNGEHHFRVRAQDVLWNVDETPAIHSWTVNLPAMAVSLLSRPSGSTPNRSALFTFSGGSSVASLECSLDSAVYTPCTSPHTLSELGNGVHTFAVRGVTASGERGVPVTATWTVVNRLPTATSRHLTAFQGTPIAITLAGSDGNGDALTYTLGSQPQYGSLRGTAPQLIYTSEAAYVGVDGFTFTVNDGYGGTAEGDITITLIAKPSGGLPNYYLPLVMQPNR